MADEKPSTKYYQLRGVNQKVSKYEFPIAEALDLRNLDFDVPNAWQKRPGSTFAIGSSLGTSGPISSLFEFQKLDGTSFIVAGSDTALFYLAAGGLTLLSPGWNNGQPADMLTFVNKMWAANGQKWSWFDGASFLPVGLPIESQSVVGTFGGTFTYLFSPTAFASSGGSYFTVNGATMTTFNTGGTTVARAIYVAYAYLRKDGYLGPADFQNTARNIVMTSPGNGAEFFGATNSFVGGFTIPAGRGITAVAVYFAEDTIYNTGDIELIPSVGIKNVGALGWLDNHANKNFASITLKPNADLSRFWLYTLIPATSLFAGSDIGGTYFAATLAFGASTPFSFFDGVPFGDFGFSGMTFDLFSTFIPKYIEVNQNIMFATGFSAAPSDVRYSEVGEPETYLDDSVFEVRTNDGDRNTGAKAFNDQYYVMKEKSFHKLIGNSADNFQLVEMSTEYGCLSNKTILQVKQKLYWLDRKGILEFNGASFDIVSTEVEGMFRRMNITAAKEKACAVHHLYRNQIWFGIPVDNSTVNNITIVYDYLVEAWTFFEGFNPASFAMVQGTLTKPTAWRGDYSGMIHYSGESFYADSGLGITCMVTTRFENVGGENQTTLWRRFFLDVAMASGATGLLSGKLFSNYDSSTVQGTFAMFQDQFQTRAEIGLLGKAAAAQISHFSASLPLLLNGYAWTNRGLRNV